MELRYLTERPGRLSGFLRRELRMSTGLINRLKYRDGFLVDGIPVHTDYAVKPGQEIRVLLDEEVPEYPAEKMDLSILYEDEDLIALDKPAGILIHPSRNRDRGTLANGLAYYYKQTGQRCAFHPISRLDRDTYGLVLLAKNSHVHALMNEEHRLGRIQKTYHALVFGGPPEDRGLIDAPIERLPLPSLLRQVGEGGKPSQTEYRVLERLEGAAVLELRPLTGRTHQLRVHCSYMGWPILGDPQYGSPASMACSERLGLSTQALCAKELHFFHPMTGVEMGLISRLEVPADLLRKK